MADEPCQPPDPNPATPRVAPPPGSVDTHAHIYGPFDRFPLAARRGYTPHPLGFEDYCAMLSALGIDRAVIVHGSANGLNHAVTLDAIARSEGRFKGVCIVRPETAVAELDAMAGAGICGLRLSATVKGGLSPAYVDPMTAKAKELGWLVQLHLRNIDEFPPLVPWIERSGVEVLIDHLGRPRASQSVDCPAFRTLLSALRANGNLWVKICSWYRLSDAGPPYDDMRPFVEALAAAAPDRILWGTNWPHPNITIPMPNDGILIDQLMEWVKDDYQRRAILCDNPARLFGFAPL